MNYIEEKITFAELAKRLNVLDLETPAVYDMEDEYEIRSYDMATGQEVWSPLQAFVVKNGVQEHYQLNTLHGTADHKVLHNGEFIRLADHPAAELVKMPMQVVDCLVGNTHTYVAEGQINHNTTTPGGMAIPFMSSVRVKIMGGSHIEVGDGNDKRVVGINVTAKTVKNKVASPFRTCDFQIHFGRGISEGEEMFDVVRNYCDKNSPVIIGNKKVLVEGTGAWKTFTVSDNETGEGLIDKKFRKTEFGDLFAIPECKGYLDDLVERSYVVKMGETFEPSIDEESYVEAEAMAIEKVTSEQ
jgi:hypothetical protein